MAKKATRKKKGRTAAAGKKGSRARVAARRKTAGRRKTARSTGGRGTRASRTGGRTRKAAARRARKGGRPAARRTGAGRRATSTTRRRAKGGSAKARRGRERDLAQTPETGRTVKGPTNPMRTVRSTGTAAGAGDTRRAPGLERERRRLRDLEETVPEPPSSLNMDRHGSAARTGRAEMRQARREHTETSPVLTGGDVDADWEDAYAVGDEAPGGDNPTPDQDRVDDIGRALGIEYQDNEELKFGDKEAERDKHRWELDPASSEDYKDRD